MTINGLWQYANKNLAHLLRSIPFHAFSGKRIAIDVGNWFFVLRCAIRSGVINRTDVLVDSVDEEQVDKLLLQDIMRRLVQWMTYGITPILIFDGPSSHKKTATKIARTQQREKTVKALLELEQRIQEEDMYHAGSSLAVMANREADLKKKRTLMSQLTSMSSDTLRMLRTFFEGAGIPTMTCNGDAERLASLLTHDGTAAAVFSADGDCLIHGARILLRDVGVNQLYGSTTVPTFEAIFYNDFRIETELKPKQLIDAAIISGCDYNPNLPRVAFATAIKLIRTHKRIEKLPSKYDIRPLDHEESRELFVPISVESALFNCELKLNIDPIDTKIEPDVGVSVAWQHFSDYNMEAYCESFVDAMKAVPPPRDFQHDVIEDGIIIAGERLKDMKNLEVRKATTKAQARAKTRRSQAASSVSDEPEVIIEEKPKTRRTRIVKL